MQFSLPSFRSEPAGWSLVSGAASATTECRGCTRQWLYGLMLVAATLLGVPARAQNASVVATQPTQDRLLYSRHSPSACPRKLARQDKQTLGADKQCLTHRARRQRRYQYQEQHRSEFPAAYQPGVE